MVFLPPALCVLNAVRGAIADALIVAFARQAPTAAVIERIHIAWGALQVNTMLYMLQFVFDDIYV